MNQNGAKYPLDFEALEKGYVITAAEIEKISGKQRGTDEYKFAQLSLKERVEREMALLGKPATCKCERDDLRILTDSEAAKHTHDLFMQAISAMRRNFGRKASVDIENLTDEERKRHEHQLINQGRYVQALSAVGKQIMIEAHSRRVPGLPAAVIQDEGALPN